ncbi:hypothetical protein EZJ19_01080 [Parasulfuritortus cantonensis]|uniref:Uncharacterized protein n=1 Tax=Parasulfuritortus cantonensis TaxID=2528202 RepID=A0A4R1BQF5_9PROT|nr:hypothetical protein [Parasulfuritortus cantonensis]TCJ19788.1 hypothetical protein EZJ19_01080 [Parasulfuritortus cantonensis]
MTALVRCRVRLALAVERPPYEGLLKRLWQGLYGNRPFRALASRCLDKLNLRGGDFAYLVLVRELIGRGVAVSPEYRWRDAAAVDAVARAGGPAIVVSVHSGFAFNVRTFSDLGRKVTMIAANPEGVVDHAFRNAAVNARDVTIVKRDQFCLVRLRRALVAGDVICSAVDYRSEQAGQYDLVSPSLFDFSAAFGVPLYCTYTSVDPDGVTEGVIEGPLEGDSAERLEQFMAFLKEHRPGARYAVRRY